MIWGCKRRRCEGVRPSGGFYPPYLGLVLALLGAGEPPAQLDAVLSRPQHRAAVLAAVKQSTTWVRRACETPVFTPLPGIRIWQQPRFDETGTLLEGAWGESVEASGCGITRVLNAATIVRGPGTAVTQVLAPGATQADPALQKDASRFVFTAAMQQMPGCPQAFIDNTQVVGQEAAADPRLTGPVSVEHWTVLACGQDFTVQVRFMPVKGGTDIAAHVL